MNMTRRRFLNTSGRLAVTAAPILMTGPSVMADTTQTAAPPEPPIDIDRIITTKGHHGDGIFINPFGPAGQKGLRRVLYWKLFAPNHHDHLYANEKIVPVTIDWAPISSHTGVSVTYIKHAGVMIRDKDRTVLVDPVFDSIFGVRTDFTPRRFSIQDMPQPDHILITHGHYDHLDMDSLAQFPSDTHVISPLGYDRQFQDLSMGQRTQLDWLDAFEKNGWRITLTPANHWTMRNPLRGPNRSLWGGYMIETPSGATIYLAGDTATFDGFAFLAQRFAIDLAIFNLGAYAPRWMMEHSHMNPTETVDAFTELNAKKLMIAHWGTFRLGDEPVYLPPADLKSVLAERGLSDAWLHLTHGQTAYL